MPQPEMGSHQTYFFTYPFVFPVIFVYFFQSSIASPCAPPSPPHTTPPPNINCLFDCSFPVSLSQKLPEVPRLPASAGFQDAQHVPIAVRFASESPSSEKHHQIPVHLLWLAGIYTHTSEFQHILGTHPRFDKGNQSMLAAPKKENSLNRTKYKTHTESN